MIMLDPIFNYMFIYEYETYLWMKTYCISWYNMYNHNKYILVYVCFLFYSYIIIDKLILHNKV